MSKRLVALLLLFVAALLCPIAATGLFNQIMAQQAAQSADTDSDVSQAPAAEVDDEDTASDLDEEPVLEPTPPPFTADHLVISEIALSINDVASEQFIELFNPTDEAIDLNGWSLLVLGQDDEGPRPIYRWETRQDVPAYGRYLLTSGGTALNVLGDALFAATIPADAGLILQGPDGSVVDVVSWGNAPEEAITVMAAPAVDPGTSLARVEDQDSDNDAQDFTLLTNPTPQNSGSPILDPLPFGGIRLFPPETAAVGEEFVVVLSIANDSYSGSEDIVVSLPIPEGLFVTGEGLEERLTADRRLETTTPLPAGEQFAVNLNLEARDVEGPIVFNGAYLEADGQRVYAPVAVIDIVNEILAISAARDAESGPVTVQGTVTLPTNRLAAGDDSVFYMEDLSGGIAVQLPVGRGESPVQIGDVVRVQGVIEQLGDGAGQRLIANELDIVTAGSEAISPLQLALSEAEDPLNLGRLVSLSGLVSQFRERPDGYEIELTDDEGRTISTFLDRLTGSLSAPLALGEQVEVTGLLDQGADAPQLVIRDTADILLRSTPGLQVDLAAPQVTAADLVPVTIAVTNETSEPLTDILVSTGRPSGTAAIVILANGDTANSEVISWLIPEISAGDTTTITYRTEIIGPEGQITFAPVSATAGTSGFEATSEAFTTILGDSIPIYALQGSRFTSPFLGEQVTTIGTVTAVLPDLGGFWIQDAVGDGNINTSDGLFVSTTNATADVTAGDLVQISGLIQELGGQTTLVPSANEDLNIIGQGDLDAIQTIALNPPLVETAAAGYYEALEGMLVAIDEPAIVVSPSNRFGEYKVVLARNGSDGLESGNSGWLITVDDGLDQRFASPEDLAYAVEEEDVVSQLRGPLASFLGQFKIEPLEPPTIERSAP